MQVVRMYKGNDYAYFDLEVSPGLIIKGFKLAESKKNGEWFVGVPSIKNPNGQGYKQFAEFESENGKYTEKGKQIYAKVLQLAKAEFGIQERKSDDLPF